MSGSPTGTEPSAPGLLYLFADDVVAHSTPLIHVTHPTVRIPCDRGAVLLGSLEDDCEHAV